MCIRDRLRGINLAIEDMSPKDLAAYDLYEGKTTHLEFEGGLLIEGEIITGRRDVMGKIILISFKNCTVRYKDQILFRPEWGIYDLAIGKEVVSAYSGPADYESFDLISHVPSSKTIKAKKNEKRLALEQLYQQVRKYREHPTDNIDLHKIAKEINEHHENDWLLMVEITELAHLEDDEELLSYATTYLENYQHNHPKIKHLITDGLDLIFEKETI